MEIQPNPMINIPVTKPLGKEVMISYSIGNNKGIAIIKHASVFKFLLKQIIEINKKGNKAIMLVTIGKMMYGITDNLIKGTAKRASSMVL